MSSPHQTASPPQSDVGEHAHTSIQLSHPPNITSLNFHVDLVASSSSCHMYFIPQHLSAYFDDPLDCTILCFSIPNSTPIVNEDKSIDEVGVSYPTYVVIYDEYDWEPEHQLVVKDDLLLFVPPFLFPDIFGNFSISDFILKIH